MKTVVTRLADGQDLLDEIKKFVSLHNIKAGVILSAVGSLSKSNIRLPVINNE